MINFIILSCNKDDKSLSMTENLIRGITNSIFIPTSKSKLDHYRIIVVESGKHVNYDNSIVIDYDKTKYDKFNYNYALNQAIVYCQKNFSDNDWFCFLNNDVLVSRHWIEDIDYALESDPTIQSLSPNIREFSDDIRYGYTIWKHLDGCCIMCKKEVIDQIGLFDEAFLFYFQDDDYLEQLRLHNIKHAKIMSSMIKHLGSQTMPEDKSIYPLLFYCRDVFIKKYSLETYIQREKEKHAK